MSSAWVLSGPTCDPWVHTGELPRLSRGLYTGLNPNLIRLTTPRPSTSVDGSLHVLLEVQLQSRLKKIRVLPHSAEGSPSDLLEHFIIGLGVFSWDKG